MAEEIKRFDMVSATDVGRVRPHNEDSIAADPDIGVATLADGMGGYNAGEVASSGEVVVSDRLPAGLLLDATPSGAAAAARPGWSSSPPRPTKRAAPPPEC